MADFPRITWIEADGRRIPSTEPQHFTGNGDETVRTGRDNPLPVANYVENESGILLPVSHENPVPTQLTGSNMDIIDIYYDVEVPARATTRLDSVDCSDYKDLYMQYVPRGLTAFTLRCYIVRASGLGDLTGMLVEERSRSSNGVTERFQINSTRVSAAITNDTDEDHVFGELFLVGVKR